MPLGGWEHDFITFNPYTDPVPSTLQKNRNFTYVAIRTWENTVIEVIIIVNELYTVRSAIRATAAWTSCFMTETDDDQ